MIRRAGLSDAKWLLANGTNHRWNLSSAPVFCLLQVDDHRNRKTTIRLTLDARHGISFRRRQLRTGQFERFNLQVVNQDVTNPEQGQLQRQ